MNLFVWPARNAAQRSFVKDGLKVNEWSLDGLRFAAITDSGEGEPRKFSELFEKGSR